MRRVLIAIGLLAVLLAVGHAGLAGAQESDKIGVDAKGQPTCRGEAATIILKADQTVIGTEARDVAVGTAGNDHFVGRGGDDLVCLGAGDDTFTQSFNKFEDGVDRVYGGPVDDDLAGGTSDDRLAGGPGADVLDGGPGGSDRCNGGADVVDDVAIECDLLIAIP